MKLLLPLCLFTLLPLLSSCEDMFETESDRQIFDPALDQKTDSMFYTLGILKGLQQAADQYVLTGEMRGDLVATNAYTEADLLDLADFSADVTNKYDSAYLYYRVINNCNYYIAHRDTTLLTGSRKVAIPEYVEALAVRAWAYMQLAKTYGEVPFYTDPLVSIGDANRNLPTKDLQGICDELSPEMMKYSGTPVPAYGNIDDGKGKTINSSKAMLPVDAVLGDLFLETHQYALAAQYYFNYILMNKLVIHQAYLYPDDFRQIDRETLPKDIELYRNANDESRFDWSNIFSMSSPQDIVTYIPLASNKFRGEVTELPRYFGYDFYNTNVTSTNDRYLVERQIDASKTYTQLNKQQLWYYMPATATDIVKTLELGDMRQYVTMKQVSKEDSIFSVMTKFFSANVPIYRTATIYLRLAEALNRMEQPEAAFAILKDGIKDDPAATYNYFHPSNYDGRMGTFDNNWGIHSRGTNYTQGAFSPYQMDSLVTVKLNEFKTVFGITPTGNLNDTINAMEDIICDEMALELAFEGNRFGDLTRMALHKNEAGLYGADFGSRWLARKLAYKNPKKDLTDKKNWYLPFK